MTMNQSTVTVTEDSDRPYGEQSDGCRDRQLRPACLPVLADSPDTTRTCGYWLGRVHTPRVRVGSGRCLTIFARKKIIKYAFMEKNFKFSTSQSTKMCYFRKKKQKIFWGQSNASSPDLSAGGTPCLLSHLRHSTCSFANTILYLPQQAVSKLNKPSLLYDESPSNGLRRGVARSPIRDISFMSSSLIWLMYMPPPVLCNCSLSSASFFFVRCM